MGAVSVRCTPQYDLRSSFAYVVLGMVLTEPSGSQVIPQSNDDDSEPLQDGGFEAAAGSVGKLSSMSR